jgi:hypothetical protein
MKSQAKVSNVVVSQDNLLQLIQETKLEPETLEQLVTRSHSILTKPYTITDMFKLVGEEKWKFRANFVFAFWHCTSSKSRDMLINMFCLQKHVTQLTEAMMEDRLWRSVISVCAAACFINDEIKSVTLAELCRSGDAKIARFAESSSTEGYYQVFVHILDLASKKMPDMYTLSLVLQGAFRALDMLLAKQEEKPISINDSKFVAASKCFTFNCFYDSCILVH